GTDRIVPRGLYGGFGIRRPAVLFPYSTISLLLLHLLSPFFVFLCPSFVVTLQPGAPGCDEDTPRRLVKLIAPGPPFPLQPPRCEWLGRSACVKARDPISRFFPLLPPPHGRVVSMGR